MASMPAQAGDAESTVLEEKMRRVLGFIKKWRFADLPPPLLARQVHMKRSLQELVEHECQALGCIFAYRSATVGAVDAEL